MELVMRAGPFTICTSRRVRLASITTHLLNFPDFIGRDDFMLEMAGGLQRRHGRILLGSAEWAIEVQATPDTKRLVAELKASGGNAVTHVACIRRANGRTFSMKDAERILTQFHKLMSFASGRWCPVVGTTGVGIDGAVVYEEWACLPSAPWGGRMNWFDEHHGETLSDLFPGFVDSLTDPKIGAAVSAAHYWYLRSNRGGEAAGADGSLILSQAALEGLSAGYLAALGKPAGGNAAEKIRRLLGEMGIPASIPKGFKNLRNGLLKGAWQDGPHAITKVRNELVHPEKRSIVPVGKSVTEAWQLAQWYLELAILRAAGYAGHYSSRLSSRWVGEVESVPWAPKTP